MAYLPQRVARSLDGTAMLCGCGRLHIRGVVGGLVDRGLVCNFSFQNCHCILCGGLSKCKAFNWQKTIVYLVEVLQIDSK